MQSLFLLPPSFILGSPLQTALFEIFVLAAFGLLFAIASVTLAEGAKRVPSGQTALIVALEVPLAPILAFIIFKRKNIFYKRCLQRFKCFEEKAQRRGGKTIFK